MAHLEAVLHMRCVGREALRSGSIKLVPLGKRRGDEQDQTSATQHDDNNNSLYLFGKMVVRGTHRSNHLKEPCPLALRFSGKHALRLISLGKHPGTFFRSTSSC